MKAQPYLNESSRKQFSCQPGNVLEIYGIDPGSDVYIWEEINLIGNPFINGYVNAGSHIHVDFDPPTGIPDGPKYGRVVLQIVPPGGRPVYDTIYYLPCCDGPSNLPLPEHVVIWESTNDLIARGINSFDNSQYWIMEVLTVDANYQIENNSLVRLQWDARIDLQLGAQLEIRDSELNALCRQRWDGITTLDGSNLILVHNATIRHSARGLVGLDDAFLDVSDSEFRDNVMAISMLNYVTSNLALMDNQFIWPHNYIGFSSNTQIDLTGYAPFSAPSSNISCQILIEQSNNIQLSTGGGNNYFEVTGVSQFMPNADAIGCYNSTASISEIEAGYFSRAVASETSEVSIDMAYFYENHYSLNASTSQNIMTNSLLENSPFAVYLSNAGGNQGLELNNNLQRGLKSVIFGDAPATMPPYDVLIIDNNFEDAELEARRLQSPTTLSTPGADEGFVVRNNGFTNTQLFVEDAAYVRIGHNTFAYPTTSGGPTGIGLFLRNAVGAQVKNNTFNNLEVGMVGEQDLTDAVFSCNTMKDCNVGWRFNSGAILSNQGSPTEGVNNTFDNCSLNIDDQGILFLITYYQLTGLTNGLTANPSALFILDPRTTAISSPSCSSFTKRQFAENTLNQLTVFPNPAKDFFILKSFSSFGNYEIYSLQGKLIKSGDYGPNETTIPIDFPNGVYIIRLISSDSHFIENRKLVVNND